MSSSVADFYHKLNYAAEKTGAANVSLCIINELSSFRYLVLVSEDAHTVWM